jgi:peptidoglycan-N-acetylglucosamine deacetylase
MALKRVPCKNHADRLTVRKCYFCKDAICSYCQKTLEHHLFCGFTCYLRWKWNQIRNTIPVAPEVVILFALLLFSNLLLIGYFNQRINSLRHELIANAQESQITIADEASVPVKMDSVRFPLENMLQLKIQLREGNVAVLKRDGRFIDSQIQNEQQLVFGNQYLNQGENSFALYMLENNGRSYLIDSFSVRFHSTRLAYLSRSIEQIKERGKYVTLTFDGGSMNKGTRQILDILRGRDVCCTMFLTGDFIERYPDLVRQMIDDGHEIANHSYSHPHLTMLEQDGSNHTLPGVDRNFLHQELLKTDSIFLRISGRPLVPFWRAPFGEINRDILQWAAEVGYKHIGWSRYGDTRDWVTDSTSTLYRTSQQILEHLLSVEKKEGLNGKIILMHLSSDREKDFPYTILGRLIEDLRSRGYSFKTISQLLAIS